MAFLVGLLTFIFAVICILIIAIVLLQPHQGDGLAGALGGMGGGGDSFFGTKAVSAAARITVVLAIFYIGLALLLNARFMHGAKGLMAGEHSSTERIVPPVGPEKDHHEHESSGGGGSKEK